MRAKDDKKTADLLPNFDLAGEVPQKPTAKELNAARVQRFRDKHGVAAMTVNIDAQVLADFDAWCASKGKKKAAVIEHLLKTQLLRKR